MAGSHSPLRQFIPGSTAVGSPYDPSTILTRRNSLISTVSSTIYFSGVPYINTTHQFVNSLIPQTSNYSRYLLPAIAFQLCFGVCH